MHTGISSISVVQGASAREGLACRPTETAENAADFGAVLCRSLGEGQPTEGRRAVSGNQASDPRMGETQSESAAPERQKRTGEEERCEKNATRADEPHGKADEPHGKDKESHPAESAQRTTRLERSGGQSKSVAPAQDTSDHGQRVVSPEPQDIPGGPSEDHGEKRNRTVQPASPGDTRSVLSANTGSGGQKSRLPSGPDRAVESGRAPVAVTRAARPKTEVDSLKPERDGKGRNSRDEGRAARSLRSVQVVEAERHGSRQASHPAQGPVQEKSVKAPVSTHATPPQAPQGPSLNTAADVKANRPSVPRAAESYAHQGTSAVRKDSGADDRPSHSRIELLATTDRAASRGAAPESREAEVWTKETRRHATAENASLSEKKQSAPAPVQPAHASPGGTDEGRGGSRTVLLQKDAPVASLPDRKDTDSSKTVPLTQYRQVQADLAADRASAGNASPAEFRSAVTRAMQQTESHVVRNARFIQSGGRSKVRLELDPPELGRMKLEVELRNGGIEVRLRVENPDVREAIRGQLQSLDRSLRDGHVEVNRFDVSDYNAGQRGGSASGGWQEGPAQGSDHLGLERVEIRPSDDDGWVRISGTGVMDCLV